MKTTRLGILGFAHGHIGMYADRWQKQPELGVVLAAGWDHDAERAKASCQQHLMAPAASPQDLLNTASGSRRLPRHWRSSCGESGRRSPRPGKGATS